MGSTRAARRAGSTLAPAARAIESLFWRGVALLRHPGHFLGTDDYWRRRYERGGRSGAGSRGRLASFKAEILNAFVAREHISSVIELGCGDGSQLLLARYPRYIGLDVSDAALARCRRLFADDPTKTFLPMPSIEGVTAELGLSLDVVYHLVEDRTFEAYMHALLGAATRYVIIYSSNTADNRGFEGTHIRHRVFTRWIDARCPDWTLVSHIPNRYPPRLLRAGSFADFFIYARH